MATVLRLSLIHIFTLADKTVTKTGRPVTIDAAAVAGVAGGTTPDGSVTCIYYTDFACTTPTYAARENEGTAPVDIGTYYVKATIAASGNYGTNTSQAAKLTIKEEPVYSINGTVENDTDPATALSGVTIRVMSGATKVGLAATTGADGSFVLYGIPSGTYNLVAEYGEKTVTKIIAVENADISLVSSIVMPVSYTHLDVYKRQRIDRPMFPLDKDMPDPVLEVIFIPFVD